MNIGSANKTNSSGWKRNPGSASHRLAPPTFPPNPGIQVRSNKTHENKNIMLLCFLNFSLENNMHTNIKVTPSPMNWNCLRGCEKGFPASKLLRSDNEEIIIIPQPLKINGIITSIMNIRFCRNVRRVPCSFYTCPSSCMPATIKRPFRALRDF